MESNRECFWSRVKSFRILMSVIMASLVLAAWPSPSSAPVPVQDGDGRCVPNIKDLKWTFTIPATWSVNQASPGDSVGTVEGSFSFVDQAEGFVLSSSVDVTAQVGAKVKMTGVTAVFYIDVGNNRHDHPKDPPGAQLANYGPHAIPPQALNNPNRTAKALADKIKDAEIIVNPTTGVLFVKVFGSLSSTCKILPSPTGGSGTTETITDLIDSGDRGGDDDPATKDRDEHDGAFQIGSGSRTAKGFERDPMPGSKRNP